MFSCSYNKDESAIEVAERLTPEFEKVLKKLNIRFRKKNIYKL